MEAMAVSASFSALSTGRGDLSTGRGDPSTGRGGLSTGRRAGRTVEPCKATEASTCRSTDDIEMAFTARCRFGAV